MVRSKKKILLFIKSKNLKKVITGQKKMYSIIVGDVGDRISNCDILP